MEWLWKFCHSCGKYYISNDPMTGLSQWESIGSSFHCRNVIDHLWEFHRDIFSTFHLTPINVCACVSSFRMGERSYVRVTHGHIQWLASNQMVKIYHNETPRGGQWHYGGLTLCLVFCPMSIFLPWECIVFGRFIGEKCLICIFNDKIEKSCNTLFCLSYCNTLYLWFSCWYLQVNVLPFVPLWAFIMGIGLIAIKH